MLRILKKTSDSHTGRIAVTCCVVEKDGNSTTNGAEETHGISPEELETKYGGDPKVWLQVLHRDMKVRHAARKSAEAAMQKLKDVEFIQDEEK